MLLPGVLPLAQAPLPLLSLMLSLSLPPLVSLSLLLLLSDSLLEASSSA